jgi:hypothetical protein
MPWTEANQQGAKEQIDAFVAEFNVKFEDWRASLQSGQAGVGEAATQDVLRRWREYTETLRAQSDAAVANEGVMDRLATVVDQLTEHKTALAALQSEAGTRSEAADSVNPKARASPYTNILGLQRIFRESTRQNILIATVIFAVLAVASIVFLSWRIWVTGTVAQSSYQLGGGASVKIGPRG